MKVKIFLTILWFLSLFVIILNAIQSGNESASLTLEITEFVKKTLSIINIEVHNDHLHDFVRICGHIIQYMIFGYISLWMLTFYRLKWYNIFRTLYVMVLDETIQFFTPGRAAEVLDIFLDIIGIIIAFIIFIVSEKLFVKHRG